MPYTTITLQQFITRISAILDDTAQKYWTNTEIQYATYEALRVWGGLTNYWRTRGTFNLTPVGTAPYTDLSVALPQYRTRVFTLGQMVQEIQYMLLENPSGVAGTGMSGQIAIGPILAAIQDARNRFVLDTHLPITINGTVPGINPSGMVVFPQVSVFVHRAYWQDTPGGGAANGAVYNLWRQDTWAADKNNTSWTVDNGAPVAYSQAESSPLSLQVIPPPANVGTLSILSVDSEQVDLTNSAATFNVPDEYVHAIKYAALSHLLSTNNQLFDPLRAQYCETRYTQAAKFAVDGASVIRLLLNNQPLPIDTLDALDASNPYWSNRVGKPESAGVMYDMVSFNPGRPDQLYGIAADVVQVAPIPTLTQFMQIGPEDMDHIQSYVLSYLAFKCGGSDFKSTLTEYDSYMKAVSNRKAINSADIQYMASLFNQPQSEWAKRPDMRETANA